MYIKEIKKKNKYSDKIFVYHRLVESYRTPKGPRQRIILNLGTLTIPEEQWKMLADRIEEIIHKQNRLFNIPEEIEKLAQHYASLIVDNKSVEVDSEIKEEEENFHEVDINTIETSNVKTIGGEYLSYSYLKKLKLDELFKKLGFTKYEQDIAIWLIVGRLLNPGSELSTYEWGLKISGMDELLNTNFKNYSLSGLYRTSELLYKNKDKIEEYLREEEKNIYSLDEKIILYDLTNTYFEGRHYDKKITFGRSKEKRRDCRLITMGLVVDEYGFPKKSEFFEGNVSEPKTLEKILEQLKSEKTKTIIIDAGIATEENLKMIKEKGFDYLCVSRSKPKEDDKNNDFILIKETEDNKIEARLVKKENEQNYALNH